MMNLQQINELIQTQKRPYLQLKIKDGLNHINAGAYNCENLEDEADNEDKVNNSITWLNHFVTLFPNNTVFYVYCKASKNANQSGISGPFEFRVSTPEPEQQTNNMNGLSGFNGTPPGYVHESEVKAKLLEQQLDFERRMFQKDFDQMKTEFNEKLEQVAESTKEYNPEKLTGLANAIAGLLGKKPSDNLGNVKDEPTIKEIAAREFAELLVEKFPLHEIERLKQTMLNPRQEKNENPETNE